MAKKTPTETGKPKGKRGGRRAGAGRKPTVVTVTTQELDQAVNDRIGGMALDLVENLKRLADGGYPRVTETMEPATEQFRETVERDEDGNPKLDPRGNPVMVRTPLFPDAKPGDLVVTRRVVETAEPDRAANEYLLNRRLGRPRQAIELSGPDGTPIPISMETAIELVYGEAGDDVSPPRVVGVSAPMGLEARRDGDPGTLPTG